MKIAIGSDHGGYTLKEIIKKHLEEKGFNVKDFGTDSAASTDYPDFAKKVGEAVAAGDFEKGILVCGTGIGISIAANKIPGYFVLWLGIVFQPRRQDNTIILIL